MHKTPRSQETKKKISEAMKKFYQEHPEIKEQISKKLKGNIPWNKGMKMPESFREKCRSKNLSHLKKYQFQKGRKHPYWKGGVCRDKHYLGKKEYRLWRKAVFERDNYTCQICKIRGGDLEAHHIFPWAKYPELRFNIQNGMTVHKKCHPKDSLK